VRGITARHARYVRGYFYDEPLTCVSALVPPHGFLASDYITRLARIENGHMYDQFIFDEQEAILANPYVRSVRDPRRTSTGRRVKRDFGGSRTIADFGCMHECRTRVAFLVGAHLRARAEPVTITGSNVLLTG